MAGIGFKRGQGAVRLDKVIPRVEAPANYGLTGSQAAERLENGYANFRPASAEKTIGRIFRDNILTYFNLVFVVLAVCIIAVGAYNNLTFMPIVIINCIIGIVQEIRSKQALAKLSFISAPHAAIIRDGQRITLPTEETVLDDIALFSAGVQIYADAIVIGGQCQVNEALVTGEADEVTKNLGDTLLSGSYIVSGDCVARLDKVGRDSFVAQLTIEAKKAGVKRTSGMMTGLRRLVLVIGIIIVPIGIMMFLRQTRQVGIEVREAVVTTVAALIGMIPEGLYLLVSVALTVSVMRLARKKTLVHEMGCVELLARVDVLCVDKTGTITEPVMEVKGVALLCEDRFNNDDINTLISNYADNMSADNETMIAVKSAYAENRGRKAMNTMPFSSATKFSGVSFHEDETYYFGAPERILSGEYHKFRDKIETYSAQGFRVLLLALSDRPLSNKPDASRVMPLALVLLSNRIREAAPATFNFFANQGVKIIVISGDNPVTVSQIAREAGIEGAERFIDAAELVTDRQIRRAVNENIVFGRVTPDQKRKLVRALKAAGHTVAMTGDGVNDVLALKDANCSIAMASGSEVASQVADIVLLDSDFASMPAVVMEGRRVINNIERSSALFLMKNIFSFLLALTTMVLALPYPLSPAQLSLFNMMIIGAPSFVLALEPNRRLVRGKFMLNVLRNALPAGLTHFIALFVLVLMSSRLDIPAAEMSTMACITITFIGLLMLYRLGHPLNRLRIALIVCMITGFILGGTLLNGIFEMSSLSSANIWITIAFCLGAAPVMLVLSLIFAVRKKA